MFCSTHVIRFPQMPLLHRAVDLGAIANAVKLNFLFQDLTPADRQRVVEAMVPVQV